MRLKTHWATGDRRAGGGNIQFEIAAVYVPFADDSDAAPRRDPAKKSRASKSASQYVCAVASTVAERRTLMASIREVRKMLVPVLIGLVRD